MNKERLSSLIDSIADGSISKDEAIERLSHIDYEDLGFARLDNNRELRTGVPEVIFCQGKSDSQIVTIFERLSKSGSFVIGTRLIPEVYERIKDKLSEHSYSAESRMIWHGMGYQRDEKDGFAAVISAGTADIPAASEAALTCQLLGTPVKTFYDIGVAGIHRLLETVPKLEEANVIVVAAGMEGTLPGVVAGLVSKPVIALPTSVGYGTGLRGVSALLTMLNSCAAGLSIVNIDNGFGAGYLAHKINITNR